jgi:hypothetical protein
MSRFVKITQKQADAILHARGEYSDADIVECQIDPMPWSSGREALDGMSVDTLIRALYIGYTVEETPEDKVREYYNELTKKQKSSVQTSVYQNDTGFKIVDAEIRGLIYCLGHLNKKIEGVNS